MKLIPFKCLIAYDGEPVYVKTTSGECWALVHVLDKDHIILFNKQGDPIEAEIVYFFDGGCYTKPLYQNIRTMYP